MLRAIGVAGGVTMLGGVASAKPGNRGRGGQQNGNSADPKAACGECSEGYSYTKIDGAPEVGEEYDLGGAVVTITDVEKNDDGEVVGFNFTSDGVVEKICVKGGPVTEVYEVDFEDYDFDGSGKTFYAPDNPNSGKRYQISNIAYCNQPGVRYQADLVAGYPICDFDQANGVSYNAQNRMLAPTPSAVALSVSGVSDVTGNDVTGSTPSYRDTNTRGEVVPDDCFTETATSFHTCLPTEDGKGFVGEWVGRDTTCGPNPFVISLAVYRVPAGVDPADLDQQVLVAAKTVDATSMESGTITIDLTSESGGTVDCVTTQA